MRLMATEHLLKKPKHSSDASALVPGLREVDGYDHHAEVVAVHAVLTAVNLQYGLPNASNILLCMRWIGEVPWPGRTCRSLGAHTAGAHSRASSCP